MSGMQQEFICGFRELLKATRPHVNYVKDFERRAEQNPKACAEEAFGEVISSGRMLYHIFEETFQEDPAKAAERVFRRSSEGLVNRTSARFSSGSSSWDGQCLFCSVMLTDVQSSEPGQDDSASRGGLVVLRKELEPER